MAISKTESADVIYSNDDDIRRFAVRDNITVITIEELPHPPVEPQGKLAFDPGSDDLG